MMKMQMIRKRRIIRKILFFVIFVVLVTFASVCANAQSREDIEEFVNIYRDACRDIPTQNGFGHSFSECEHQGYIVAQVIMERNSDCLRNAIDGQYSGYCTDDEFHNIAIEATNRIFPSSNLY